MLKTGPKTRMTTALAGGLVLTGVMAVAVPQSAAAETFTLRIGSGHPSGPAVYVNLVENFFVPEVTERVAAETDHEINFIEGYDGAIAGVSETLSAVQAGLLDIGAFCFCFEPSDLFLHNFPYYAPFGPQDSTTAMEVTRAVYDANPWLVDLFESDYNQILLGLSGWDNYHLGTTDPWEEVADLEGVRIGGAGPNLPWLEYAGAVPVQSTLPDGYMSLQTGVYNGWLMFPSSYLGFSFHEPAPYYTLIGFGAMMVNGLTLNLDTMERLPDEVVDIIREVGREYEARTGPALDEQQEIGLRGLEEDGAVIRELPDDVRAEWAASLAAFPTEQMEEAESRGLPGREVMESYLAIAAEHGVEWLHDYDLE